MEFSITARYQLDSDYTTVAIDNRNVNASAKVADIQLHTAADPSAGDQYLISIFNIQCTVR